MHIDVDEECTMSQLGLSPETLDDEWLTSIVGRLVMLRNPMDREACGIGIVCNWWPPATKASEPYGEAEVIWPFDTFDDIVPVHELDIVA